MKKIMKKSTSINRSTPISMANHIGVYGMGVMGRNLAMNIASKGYRVAVYNRSYDKTLETVNICKKNDIHNLDGYETLDSFIHSLEYPRKLIVMVKAGNAVDEVINVISPFILKDDIIIDGGNEWYENTEIRQTIVHEKFGAQWIGMGVSGGEYGARYGASLMPGGSSETYNAIKDILEAAAAKVQDTPCVRYIGKGGSGNYVKMVHNGIEYGVMQTIAEIYSILKNLKGYNNNTIAHFFKECNKIAHSYLLEITIQVLLKKDEGSNDFLVDKILDMPQMNGTGTWTTVDSYKSLHAMPVPSIAAAVDARIISANKKRRLLLAEKSKMTSSTNLIIHSVPSDDELQRTLLSVMFVCYLQGFDLIRSKNQEKSWGISINDLTQIWKGGCIIRSNILDLFYQSSSEDILSVIDTDISAISKVVSYSCLSGLPTQCISASLQYILAYHQSYSPANLIQAQRDLFGAHGFERIDISGKHHSQW